MNLTGLIFVAFSTVAVVGAGNGLHPLLSTSSQSTVLLPNQTEVEDGKIGPTRPIDIDTVASQTGLIAAEVGHINKDEDNRFIATIRSAKTIRILVPNGYNLINNFKTEFTEFLAKPGSLMQVLFATSDSDWYREETEMTLGFKPGDEGYKKNVGLVALDRSRLEAYAGTENLGHLQFRYFDTQFRLPIIIVDDSFCYMTIRLSPNEAAQSLRLEFSQGYTASCVSHFEHMWNLSSTTPDKNRFLALLGLSSWSRTEILTLFGILGTIFAAGGSYLAVPAFQRFLRLERQHETTDLGQAPGAPPPSIRPTQPPRKAGQRANPKPAGVGSTSLKSGHPPAAKKKAARKP